MGYASPGSLTPAASLTRVIIVDGVGKRYGRGPTVLRGIDLELPAGRIAVVLGDNGSGKSTLLRIAAGCTTPTSGRVTGRPRSVCYLPERFPDQLKLSAAEYLRHFARIRGVAQGWEPLLERLGFLGDRDAPMSQLSKGNAQKVGIAQAFQSPKAFLVLDEPWAGLDVDARAVLGELVAEAVEAGATALVTDHTGAGAALPGAEVWHLREGVLAAATSTELVEIVVRCTPDAVDMVGKVPGVRSVRRGAGQ